MAFFYRNVFIREREKRIASKNPQIGDFAVLTNNHDTSYEIHSITPPTGNYRGSMEIYKDNRIQKINYHEIYDIIKS